MWLTVVQPLRAMQAKIATVKCAVILFISNRVVMLSRLSRQGDVALGNLVTEVTRPWLSGADIETGKFARGIELGDFAVLYIGLLSLLDR